ncbi:hypothetical protein [Mycolicibacterium sphagni]|uniref:hypothetical protein n=1 Tax=Mycolicibacterium sphagni TaxID=1786 RepID=UPI0021F2C022|nr:hypothetical protein [Mycolicibacterium sphagni]MCV7177781.1 hypothetical protein [Mycolicibacterium sphagni]
MPTIIAIVIAVIAIGVAIGAWFRPIPKPEAPAAKTYSDQEVADAKKAVCDAYEDAYRAVTTAGNGDGGSDRSAVLAVAVNIRLALGTSGQYLLSTVNEQPAAPSEVATAASDLGTAYRKISLLQLSEAPHDTIAPFYEAADSAITKIKQACG